MINAATMPALIVALDSKESRSNYIHVLDSKEDTIYYCPCCGGRVRPRCIKEGKEYKYQSHYYHIDNECSEETQIHFLYKEWLLVKGNQFKVGEKIYTVKDIEIEKSHKTSFGIYKPDITIFTQENKIFYFEIAFSNKKDTDYFPKWQELGNDAIEIDSKKMLYQNYKGEVLTFDLIYSDGKCFVDEYTSRDIYATTIGERKEEIKRQDRINYKMYWEKLDWFWQQIQLYKQMKLSVNDVVEAYAQIPFEDKELCYSLSGKLKCSAELRDRLLEVLNDEIIEGMKENLPANFRVSQISPRKISISIDYKKDYDLGHVWILKTIEYVASGKTFLRNRDGVSWKKFVDEVSHYSPANVDKHYSELNAALLQMDGEFRFSGNEYNCYIDIGYTENTHGLWTHCKAHVKFGEDHTECIASAKRENEEKLEAEIQRLANKELAKKYIDCADFYSELAYRFPAHEREIEVCLEYTHEIIVCMDQDVVYRIKVLDDQFEFDSFNDHVEKASKAIKEYLKLAETIDAYMERVNSCKNGNWFMERIDGLMRRLEFHIHHRHISTVINFRNKEDNIEGTILENMNRLIENLETYYEIRVFV